MAFIGPGVSFLSYCFGWLFVSGVCMDTAVSSIVIMCFKTAYDLYCISLTNAMEVLTLSAICSWDRSLGTQWADFFTRPKLSWMMQLMVPQVAPWALARSLMFAQQFSSMAAATAVIKWPVLTFFLLYFDLSDQRGLFQFSPSLKLCKLLSS